MVKKQSTKKLCALPLGGVGEIGMNMMVYECNGEILIVDAGVSFPSDMEAPGAEITLPDTKYLRENISKIRGVCVTHAHEDHIGALGYIWEELNDCPVYLSPFAKLVLENKLAQAGYKGPQKRVKAALHGQEYEIGPFKVEFVNITHSIPEGNSLAITTEYGTIVHTGDYKFDATPVLGDPTDEKRFAELGKQGVLAMFGDSTGAMGDSVLRSESDLVPEFESILKTAKQKIFFTTFASNTGRLIKMIELAAAHGRRVCILGRTAQNMIEHAKKLNYFPGSLTNSIVGADEAAGFPPAEVLVIASGTQGEGRSSLTRLSQGTNIRGVKVNKGDLVMLSSRMIPGNERDILDVCNNLVALGAEVMTDYSHPIHVSGHGTRVDMKKMYNLIKPQTVVPVHGEESHLVAQAKWAKECSAECGIKNVVTVRNGRKLVLAEEGQAKDFVPYVMNNTFPVGRNYVDGFNILDDDLWLLSDRKKIAFNGLVVASVAINGQTRELQGDVTLTTRGLIDQNLQAALLTSAQQKTNHAVNKVFNDGIVDDVQALDAAIQKVIRQAFNQERGKKPVIVTQVVEV